MGETMFPPLAPSSSYRVTPWQWAFGRVNRPVAARRGATREPARSPTDEREGPLSHRWRLLRGPLVPAVEGREVARVPLLPETGRAQVPVRPHLGGDVAQVVPEVDERRAAPEPVAVVDPVHDEVRF